MNQLRKWADEHQYDAESQPGATQDSGVMPSVHLLHMPDDPLGVLAAQNAIYKGVVVRHLSEITDDDRRQALDDMMRTTLQSPLEAIKMHFLFEGVDRAFTHQHVRQRTANFGQESLRFSVVGPLIDSTTLPPQLHGTARTDWKMSSAINESFFDLMEDYDFTMASQNVRNRTVWDWCIEQIDAAYHYLAEHGIAAEEARGLLPHATATRIHYQTDMRGLMKVMGERLCTQAQFHWRMVAALVQNAVRNYTPDFQYIDYDDGTPCHWTDRVRGYWEEKHRWQFELLADSGIFRPVCYQTGHCMFQASADRGCTIRERVEIRAKNGGTDSSQWHKPFLYYDHDSNGRVTTKTSEGIRNEEWLLNPAAARTTH